MSDKFKSVLVSLRKDIAIRLRVPADTPDEVVTGTVEESWDDDANCFATFSGPDLGSRVVIVKSEYTANDAIVVDEEPMTEPLSARDAKKIKAFWIVANANEEVMQLT
jgi:hypothetical protein